MSQVNVFISSKMQELAEERKVLFDLLPILNNGSMTLRAWVFEKDAPASGKSIRQVYLDALRESALYIGVFWNLYGEWTIDEFDRATEWGIERHLYVKDVEANRRDPKLKEFLETHGDVQFGVTAKWFKTLDELREAVKQSLQVWLQEYTSGPPGDLSARLYQQPTEVLELPDKLIGRDGLAAEVHKSLDQNGRVLLQGLGGTGKTALAAEVAAQRIRDGKSPILWIRAGRSKPDVLFEALARPFDAHREIAKLAGDAKIQAMRTLLAKSGVKLLVIDDVWNGSALEQAIKAVPGDMPLLVTSRQRYPLPTILKVGELDRPAALAVLSHYASADWVRDAKADALCDKLGDLAFALRIAGLTLKVDGLTPDELLERVEHSPHSLEIPSDFFSEGQESVAALLQVSLNALDEETQRIFLAFGALFAPSATAELLALYMESSEQVIDVSLTTLQRRGLTERIAKTNDSNVYHRIHDLAHSYARAQNSDEQRSKALDACIIYSERYNEPNPTNFAALRPELDNFMAAAEWATASSRYTDLELITRNLYSTDKSRFLDFQGYYSQAINLLIQTVDVARNREDKLSQGTYLHNLGYAHYSLGQYVQALECYNQAIMLHREVGNRSGEAMTLGSTGNVYWNLGQIVESITYYQQALAMHEVLGNLHEMGRELSSLGRAYSTLGRHEEAINCHRRALANTIKVRSTYNQQGLGNVLNNLGNVCFNMGHFEEAIPYYEEALIIQEFLGNLHGKGVNQEKLGKVYLNIHKYEKSIIYLQAALVIHQKIKDRYREVDNLFDLGRVCKAMGEYERAIAYYEQALKIAREIGDRRVEANSLHGIGGVHFGKKEYARALDYFQQARAIYAALGVANLLEFVDLYIARAEAARSKQPRSWRWPWQRKGK